MGQLTIYNKWPSSIAMSVITREYLLLLAIGQQFHLQCTPCGPPSWVTFWLTQRHLAWCSSEQPDIATLKYPGMLLANNQLESVRRTSSCKWRWLWTILSQRIQKIIPVAGNQSCKLAGDIPFWRANCTSKYRKHSKNMRKLSLAASCFLIGIDPKFPTTRKKFQALLWEAFLCQLESCCLARIQ